MTERCDVAVVGAGPAGARAAHDLAAAGVDVVLLDRARHPRYKTCGGGVVRRAARELPVDVDALPGLALRAAEMHAGPYAPPVRVERDEPLLWTTMRADLDAALLAAAEARGARARHPCAVEGVEAGPREVRVANERGPLRAAFVLAADGMLGPVARSAGWADPPDRVPALEWELAVDARDRERFGDAARFDFEVVPDGYAWVFPKPEHLSVGVLSTGAARGGGERKRLAEHLVRYLDGLGLAARAVERHGFVLPARPRPGPAARGRVLLLGDALGLADPITFEGIGPALASGRLAAAALVGTGLDPARAARAYRRAVGRELVGELALARPLARVLYGSARARRRLLARLGRPLCEALARHIAGETTYRRLVLSPIRAVRVGWSLAARP